MNFRKIYIVLFIVLANAGFSQDFNDALRLSMPGLGSSARALGMGNSYVAVSNDFSAVNFNPAGLGLVRNFQFSGSVENNSLKNKVTFFSNPKNDSQENTSFNGIGFVFPLPTYRGSMVFAMGYNKVKDFNGIMSFTGFNPNSTMIRDITQDENSWPPITYDLYLASLNTVNNVDSYDTILLNRLTQSGKIREEGNVGHWSFAGAVEMSKDLYIGATLNLYSGSYHNYYDYEEFDSRNIYQGLTDPTDNISQDFIDFTLSNVLSWDISGYDLKIGFIFQNTKFIKIGGTIKFPTTFTIEENFTSNGFSEFQSSRVDLPEYYLDSKYDITTPFVFEFGGSFTMYDLVANAQLSYTDYSQMEFSDGLNQSDMKFNNDEIQSLFRGTLNYNVGAEYYIKNANLTLRGGFIYQKSPFKSDPAKYDRKYITGGLGLPLGKQFSLDIAYAYGWWENFGDNYGFNESRTFQNLNQTSLLFSGTYSF